MLKDIHSRAVVSIRQLSVLNLEKNAESLVQLETIVKPLTRLKFLWLNNSRHCAFASGTEQSVFQDEPPLSLWKP